MKLNIIYIALFLCGSVRLAAQNIDHLLNDLGNNLSLMVYDHEAEAQKTFAEQFVWLPDPEFSTGIFPLPVETRLGAQIFRLSVMQMIPNKNIHKQKAQNSLLKSEPFYTEKEIKRIALKEQIKDAYLNVYSMDKQKEIISHNLEILSSLEQIALSKVKNGKGRMSEVIFIQSKRQEVEDRLKVLESKKVGPTAKINTLLYRDINDTVQLGENLDFPVWTGNIYIDQWRQNHPSFKLINDYKAILKSDTKLEDYNQKPVWGIGADYIYLNKRSDASPEFNGRDVIQLKASVQIPINKTPYKARNQSRQIKEEALDLKKEDIDQGFTRTYEIALANYNTALLTKELAENQIKNIGPTIVLLQKEYSAGDANIEMIISLEMDKIKYELEILNSIIEAYKAINTVENLTF